MGIHTTLVSSDSDSDDEVGDMLFMCAHAMVQEQLAQRNQALADSAGSFRDSTRRLRRNYRAPPQPGKTHLKLCFRAHIWWKHLKDENTYKLAGSLVRP